MHLFVRYPLAVAPVAILMAFGSAMSKPGPTPLRFSPSSDLHVLHVPHVRGTIALDGTLDDSGWLGGAAATGAFVNSQGDAVTPYSDARLTWDRGFLYVALRASDVDIEATHDEHDGPLWLDDSFHLTFETEAAEYGFDVTASGVVRDAVWNKHAEAGDARFDTNWESGVRVSATRDGTMNRPDDADEEWTVELAIPMGAFGLVGLPGEQIGFSLSRCDTVSSGLRSCQAWGKTGGTGVLSLARSGDEADGELATKAPLRRHGDD